MKVLIERLEGLRFLSEADLGRDRANRRVALGFYNDLIKYLRKNKDRMFGKSKDVDEIVAKWRAENPGRQPSRDEMMRLIGKVGEDLILPAKKFWAHPDADKLEVIIAQKNKDVAGSMQGSRYRPSMSGPALMKLNIIPPSVGEMSGVELARSISKGTVVHEFAHWMDKGSGLGPHTKKQGEEGFEVEYFNRPTEWQAYWQEGADDAEYSLRNSFTHSPFRMGRIKNFNDFSKEIIDSWRYDFRRLMDKGTRRKFGKRLYQLWKDYEPRFKKARAIVDVFRGAVEFGFESTKDDLIAPSKTPKGRVRRNKKRETQNGLVVGAAVMRKLGKYRSSVDVDKIAELYRHTLEGPLSWNSPSLAYDYVARELSAPVMASMFG